MNNSANLVINLKIILYYAKEKSLGRANKKIKANIKKKEKLA